jgi:hypothetical protein|tara:strand:- start:2997 stop:3383 length:387 start_codon:yes stop_codon:yes gene_type:complete
MQEQMGLAIEISEMLEESPTIASAERIEPQENSDFVSGYTTVRWLMEISLTHPEEILASRTQNKSDAINDSGFAGIILAHQCRDAGRQSQPKSGIPFAESPEVLDLYFSQSHMPSPEGSLKHISPTKT